ncbi:MAG TPA: hypothetical protein VGI70_10665, partial [Polyangiales bacterium]
MKLEFVRTVLFAIALAACAAAPEHDALSSTAQAARFAVVDSDYTATSISLLDADGALLRDDFIDSGSATSGLVTALSGDVVLPTRSGDPGVLILIDRLKTDVVTRIRLSDGKVLGQVRTQVAAPDESESAYSSNPQDYVYVDEHAAWVSRFEPNLDLSAEPIDRGTDLVKLDPSTMKLGSDRIDLSMFDTSASAIDPDSQASKQVDVYARPSALVHVGNTLVVGLARTSFDFSAIGSGAIALVDLDGDEATEFDLDQLENCGAVAPVAGASDEVLVSCSGSLADANPGDHAGIARLKIAGGKASVVRSWHAADHTADAVSVNDVVSIGGDKVVAVAFGQAAIVGKDGAPSSDATPDRLSVLDLESGAQTEIFEAAGAYSIGAGVFDLESGLLLVPDASVDSDKKPTAGVRRFMLGDDGTFAALDVVEVA